MRFRPASPAIASLLVAACGASPPDTAADLTALRAADSAYTAGIRTLDVPAIVGLYASDAVVFPPGEVARTGVDAIREFATTFASASALKMTAELQSAYASGDLGYTVNLVNVSFNDAQGKTISERLRDVHVWRKDATGQWKLAVDTWNAAPGDSAAAH